MMQKLTISPLEQATWRDFIQQRCGLYFTPNRLYFMEKRLWERMCHLHFSSYTDYYHYVLHNENGASEWQQLLEALVNNETSFFRHQPSHTALVEHVLPELLQRKQRQGDTALSLWSVGCSGGQEPYSLSMGLLENMESHLWQLTVYGSDISQRQLERARQGRYRVHDVRYMPEYYRNKYFKAVQIAQRTHYQISADVQAFVHFTAMNLHDSTDYPVSAQDVIFCQNVLIYFEAEDRLEIVKRLCKCLNPGGYLFLAPAELVGLRLPGIEVVHFPDTLAYRSNL